MRPSPFSTPHVLRSRMLFTYNWEDAWAYACQRLVACCSDTHDDELTQTRSEPGWAMSTARHRLPHCAALDLARRHLPSSAPADGAEVAAEVLASAVLHVPQSPLRRGAGLAARDGAQPTLHNSGRGAEQQPAAAQGGRADPAAGSPPGHTAAALSRQCCARGRPSKQSVCSWGVQALSTCGSYPACLARMLHSMRLTAGDDRMRMLMGFTLVCLVCQHKQACR